LFPAGEGAAVGEGDEAEAAFLGVERRGVQRKQRGERVGEGEGEGASEARDGGVLGAAGGGAVNKSHANDQGRRHSGHKAQAQGHRADKGFGSGSLGAEVGELGGKRTFCEGVVDAG
jgi:hypothetical protein